jgi:5'-3' exonuclease
VDVHLLDGTYELFRHFYALPPQRTRDGLEVAGLVGVLGSVLGMLEGGATHLGVATDHIIESFRNDLYDGYKTGDGIDPLLWSQFHPLEDALEAMGVHVWAMVELEADDALGAAAWTAAADPRVEKVYICTPDKDLAQCVMGTRVVQLDRRNRVVIDEAGVVAKFGVGPASIPDLLALVGDAADGYPGLQGWGKKSAAAVLARYGHLESIPPLARDWDVDVRGADRLARALDAELPLALLFRDLATLRTSAPVLASVEELRWTGPTDRFAEAARGVEAPQLVDRAQALAARRRSM